MELTPAQWLVLHFTAFMYGFNKTGLVGSAIICTPLMLMLFTPGESLGIVLPLLVVADIVTIILFRQSARWVHILKALPWAFAGIILGWLIARYTVGMQGSTGEVLLRKIIAATLVFLVLFGFYLRFRPELTRARTTVRPDGSPAPARTWFAAGMGILGGITTMLANNGGPAWVVYLMNLDLKVSEFLGTAAWLFFIQNLTKVPFGVSLGFVNLDTLHLNIYLLPALAAGLVIGFYLARRISKRMFDIVTQVFALAGSLYLLFM